VLILVETPGITDSPSVNEEIAQFIDSHKANPPIIRISPTLASVPKGLPHPEILKDRIGVPVAPEELVNATPSEATIQTLLSAFSWRRRRTQLLFVVTSFISVLLFTFMLQQHAAAERVDASAWRQIGDERLRSGRFVEAEIAYLRASAYPFAPKKRQTLTLLKIARQHRYARPSDGLRLIQAADILSIDDVGSAIRIFAKRGTNLVLAQIVDSVASPEVARGMPWQVGSVFRLSEDQWMATAKTDKTFHLQLLDDLLLPSYNPIAIQLPESTILHGYAQLTEANSDLIGVVRRTRPKPFSSQRETHFQVVRWDFTTGHSNGAIHLSTISQGIAGGSTSISRKGRRLVLEYAPSFGFLNSLDAVRAITRNEIFRLTDEGKFTNELEALQWSIRIIPLDSDSDAAIQLDSRNNLRLIRDKGDSRELARKVDVVAAWSDTNRWRAVALDAANELLIWDSRWVDGPLRLDLGKEKGQPVFSASGNLFAIAYPDHLVFWRWNELPLPQSADELEQIYGLTVRLGTLAPPLAYPGHQ